MASSRLYLMFGIKNLASTGAWGLGASQVLFIEREKIFSISSILVQIMAVFWSQTSLLSI